MMTNKWLLALSNTLLHILGIVISSNPLKLLNMSWKANDTFTACNRQYFLLSNIIWSLERLWLFWYERDHIIAHKCILHYDIQMYYLYMYRFLDMKFFSRSRWTGLAVCWWFIKWAFTRVVVYLSNGIWVDHLWSSKSGMYHIDDCILSSAMIAIRIAAGWSVLRQHSIHFQRMFFLMDA